MNSIHLCEWLTNNVLQSIKLKNFKTLNKDINAILQYA